MEKNDFQFLVFYSLLNLRNMGMKIICHFFKCYLIDGIGELFTGGSHFHFLPFKWKIAISLSETVWLIASLCSADKCSTEGGLRARGQCNNITKIGHCSYMYFLMKLHLMILAKGP